MECWSSWSAPTNSCEQLRASHKSGCKNSSLTCTMFGSCQKWPQSISTAMGWRGEGLQIKYCPAVSSSVVMSHRKMSRTSNIIVCLKWYNYHCIELTIVNVNLVMQHPWNPSWISNGSEKKCFPFLYKIVLIVHEIYHHNACMYHIEQLLKGKTVYPLAMSGCIATVAGGHPGFYMFIKTPILIDVILILMHQCDLNSWRWKWKIQENKHTYLLMKIALVYYNCAFHCFVVVFSGFFFDEIMKILYIQNTCSHKNVGIDTEINFLCQTLGKLLSFYKSPKWHWPYWRPFGFSSYAEIKFSFLFFYKIMSIMCAK